MLEAATLHGRGLESPACLIRIRKLRTRAKTQRHVETCANVPPTMRNVARMTRSPTRRAYNYECNRTRLAEGQAKVEEDGEGRAEGEAQDRRTRNGMILAPKKIKELSNGGALRGLVAQLDGTDDVKTCQLSPSALGIWHCTASASSWRAPARWHHDSEWERTSDISTKCARRVRKPSRTKGLAPQWPQHAWDADPSRSAPNCFTWRTSWGRGTVLPSLTTVREMSGKDLTSSSLVISLSPSANVDYSRKRKLYITTYAVAQTKNCTPNPPAQANSSSG